MGNASYSGPILLAQWHQGRFWVGCTSNPNRAAFVPTQKESCDLAFVARDMQLTSYAPASAINFLASGDVSGAVLLSFSGFFAYLRSNTLRQPAAGAGSPEGQSFTSDFGRAKCDTLVGFVL